MKAKTIRLNVETAKENADTTIKMSKHKASFSTVRGLLKGKVDLQRFRSPKSQFFIDFHDASFNR